MGRFLEVRAVGSRGAEPSERGGVIVGGSGCRRPGGGAFRTGGGVYSTGSFTSTVALAIVAPVWLVISTLTMARLWRFSTRVSTTSPLMKVASPVNAGLRYCALEWTSSPHSPAQAAT